ncbi:MAG: alkaline phosphatase D family protein [Acidimicrobiia bacterium]
MSKVRDDRAAFDALVGGSARDAFAQGVKSAPPTFGDAQRELVLWTRAQPVLDERDVMVHLRVWPDTSAPGARDAQTIVAMASADDDYTVRVRVRDLEPGVKYRYQFERIDGKVSEIGTAHTVDPNAREFAIGFSSCQVRAGGHWSAYREIADDDLDLFLHLGDYIYAESADLFPRARRDWHPDPTPHAHDITTYREKWNGYNRDPFLKRAHATVPFVYTWDDHEFENNWNGQAIPPAKIPQFEAAQQAMFEHMPLQRRPDDPNRTYHSLKVGDLVEIFVTDGRLYREPGRTMLGDEQAQWLRDGLRSSNAQWKLVASSTAFTRLDKDHDDSWTGFEPERASLLRFIAEHDIANVIIASGDSHVAYATELDLGTELGADVPSRVVGVEIGGGAISSPASPHSLARAHLAYINETDNGWVALRFTPAELAVDFNYVEVDQPDGRRLPGRRFTVAANDTILRDAGVVNPKQPALELTR